MNFEMINAAFVLTVIVFVIVIAAFAIIILFDSEDYSESEDRKNDKET